MATTVETAATSELRSADTPPNSVEVPQFSEHFLIRGVSWATYESLLKDFERNSVRIRMTYDRGSLEFMSPARKHERGKKRLARLVEALTDELNIPAEAGGGMTFRSELRQRGLEPDECYWIAHEADVRDKDEIDLSVDPAPDLAIEVENTRTILERLPIYADLGFPELWKYDGSHLVVLELQADSTYRERAESLCLPFLPMAEFAHFLETVKGQNQTAWIHSFRAWVRAELAPRFARPEP